VFQAVRQIRPSLIIWPSQHFIFSVSYKWVQKAGVLRSTSLERIVSSQQSSSSGPFVSYKENEVL